MASEEWGKNSQGWGLQHSVAWCCTNITSTLGVWHVSTLGSSNAVVSSISGVLGHTAEQMRGRSRRSVLAAALTLCLTWTAMNQPLQDFQFPRNPWQTVLFLHSEPENLFFHDPQGVIIKMSCLGLQTNAWMLVQFCEDLRVYPYSLHAFLHWEGAMLYIPPGRKKINLIFFVFLFVLHFTNLLLYLIFNYNI